MCESIFLFHLEKCRKARWIYTKCLLKKIIRTKKQIEEPVENERFRKAYKIAAINSAQAHSRAEEFFFGFH